MFDRKTMFAWSLSLFVGSFVMIILNLAFYGNSIATAILVASTAINGAALSSTYKYELIELLKKIFKSK